MKLLHFKTLIEFVKNYNLNEKDLRNGNFL
jgi:hypothetical protein